MTAKFEAVRAASTSAVWIIIGHEPATRLDWADGEQLAALKALLLSMPHIRQRLVDVTRGDCEQQQSAANDLCSDLDGHLSSAEILEAGRALARGEQPVASVVIQSGRQDKSPAGRPRSTSVQPTVVAALAAGTAPRDASTVSPVERVAASLTRRVAEGVSRRQADIAVALAAGVEHNAVNVARFRMKGLAELRRRPFRGKTD